MRIRDIDIANGLALAPMEGVTDVTFRRLIRPTSPRFMTGGIDLRRGH